MQQFLAKAAFPIVIGAILFAACKESRRKAELTLRNDIQDSTFNTIVVDQFVSSSGAAALRVELDPGEQFDVPLKDVTQMRFSRRYADRTRVYHVRCPLKKADVVLKLIDVHLGRMPGGCVLTRKGEDRNGITRWE